MRPYGLASIRLIAEFDIFENLAVLGVDVALNATRAIMSKTVFDDADDGLDNYSPGRVNGR